jgi:hypothetical protein
MSEQRPAAGYYDRLVEDRFGAAGERFGRCRRWSTKETSCDTGPRSQRGDATRFPLMPLSASFSSHSGSSHPPLSGSSTAPRGRMYDKPANGGYKSANRGMTVPSGMTPSFR